MDIPMRGDVRSSSLHFTHPHAGICVCVCVCVCVFVLCRGWLPPYRACYPAATTSPTTTTTTTAITNTAARPPPPASSSSSRSPAAADLPATPGTATTIHEAARADGAVAAMPTGKVVTGDVGLHLADRYVDIGNPLLPRRPIRT
jgi:hypothetical protein